ncbi:ATP-dependent RNA helicase DHX29 [Collichthys lucidus]|uniref:RNA helicase n=1 Tax=Collichthys lucidus TaxID=240159 RepID=A0A4U5V982_COLLU|nr:ATP-dependent RNA helicase DHX29 [Collichthys lucidus]
MQVSIQADLEKKIIKLVNDFRDENGDKGPISGRLTSKKLLDLYTALQRFSFKREHIEEAMKSSVLYGGDLHSALDWLCLNLKDDELPEGFTQQMQEESQKNRPRFQHPAQEKPAAPSPKAPNNPRKETNKVCVTVTPTRNHQVCFFPGTEKDEAATMKDWILRYAEQSSDDDEEEEEEGGKKTTHNPELDEKFDPNDRYLILTAQLYDAKEMAAAAKTKGDKSGQRMAQDRIRIIQQEMKPLESHPMFNPSLKVVDLPQKEKKVLPVSEDKEDLSFKLFEQAEKPAAEKVHLQLVLNLLAKVQKEALGENWKKNEPKDIRNFDYTARSWTGKSPKQFLIDWVRKNLPKSPAPAFHKVAAGRYWRCKDVWLEWRDSEQQKQEESRTAANKPRDQFISRLLTKLKQQQPEPSTGIWIPGLLGQDKAGDEEPEESWENLAGLDIGEGGELEDKSEKKGGRKEGAGALEASRELLKKLKKSSLAHKLQAEREQLPVFQHRHRVLEALKRHPVVVVAGETGSGKSTQIPQFLLEELLTGGKAAQPCNIVVTQPRRISAMSLACRVSEELGCEDGPGSKVHERSVQSDFLLTILKDVVMRRSDLRLILMSATVDCNKFSNYFNRCPVITIPGRTFPVEVSHLEDIVEETGYILEKDSEYSQKILEEEEVSISVTQKGGKITASGTLTFCHSNTVCEGVEVIVRDSSSGWDLGPDLDHFSSRTRQVLQYMNPNKINMDLLVDLIHYLDKSTQFAEVNGAVLVFLPVWLTSSSSMTCSPQTRGSETKTGDIHTLMLCTVIWFKIVALHSTLSSRDQAAAFTVPPAGVRKIVLSTNIAETGVTIPDVVFVIDTGKTKENKYHESSQMSSLVETFVSKASALQRQGRAGRVRNGFCFRLYPKYRFDAFMDYSIPEILRVPLEELCLHIMKCQYGSPEDFLSRALDPPQPQSVSNAVNLLRKIGACHPSDHVLTPLGHHLASLPVNVKIGKMLIYGAILGCLEPIVRPPASLFK